MGPGSGRWLGRVDPTAIGVVNGVVGSRDSVSIARAGLIQVVGFFFLVSGWKAAFGTRPGRALSGDRAVQRGLPVYWHRKSELSVTSARREITPRFRVHRRETGPRPSVWRSRPTRESKNRSAPRDSTDAHGVSDAPAREIYSPVPWISKSVYGSRIRTGRVGLIISDGRKLAPLPEGQRKGVRSAPPRRWARAFQSPRRARGLQGVGDQDPGSRRR